jgi:hypothetical protein
LFQQTYEMKVRCLQLLIISIFSGGILQAQHANNQPLTYSGTIFQESTSIPLPFVNIWNESKRKGFIADDKGVFKISADPGDTLVFSLLGYYSEIMVVPGINQKVNGSVYMNPQYFEFKEVKVFAFKEYEVFKEKFLELDLTNSEIARVQKQLSIEGTQIAVKADQDRRNNEVYMRPGFRFGVGGGGATQVDFDELSRRLRHRQKVIDAKFNRDIVKDVTHFEGDELTSFIAYCQFSEDFLFNSDLITILDSLVHKLHQYNAISDTL